jgi:uncharacterized cupin superfamily protein
MIARVQNIADPLGEPIIDAPRADRLIAGTPKFKTWEAEAQDGTYAGIWQSSAGTWRVEYDEWEYFNILSGYSILTPDGADPIHLRAGDRYILRPGLKGTWQVVEETTKDYVIIVKE